MSTSHFSVPIKPLHLDYNQTSDQDNWSNPIELTNLGPGFSLKELIDLLTKFDRIRSLIILEKKKGAGHSVSAIVVFSTTKGLEKMLAGKGLQIGGRFVEIHQLALQDYASYARLNTAHRKVFIKGLQPEITEQCLRNYFCRFGEVENVEIPRNHIDRTSKRIAFVTFGLEEEALNCLNCRIHKLRRKSITCRPYRDKQSVKMETYSSTLDHLQFISSARTDPDCSLWSNPMIQQSNKHSNCMQSANESSKDGTRADLACSAQNIFRFGRSSTTRIASGSQIGSDFSDCPSELTLRPLGASSAENVLPAQDGLRFSSGMHESTNRSHHAPPITTSTRKVHVSFFTIPGFF
jgi:RNA recognition motif-containing protein